MKQQVITIIICLFAINTTLTAQTYSGGTGTQSDPYLISTRADMATLAMAVNDGNEYSGKYFLLTENLTDISTVIGNTSSNYFSGIFDGGGYNLTVNINITIGGTGTAYAGVFGSLSNATIKNLSVAGTIISSGKESYAGGIGGYGTKSTISNCYNTANISSSSNGNNGASLSGGICGYAYQNTISHCYNTGNTQSDVNSGWCSGGGICGQGAGTAEKITSCFAANSNITATNGTIGIGRITGNSLCIIQMSYALSSMLLNGATVSSQSPSSYHGADATMANFQSQQWIEDNLFWDFVDTWYIPAATSALPVLKKGSFLKFVLSPANITYGDMQQMTLTATSKNTTEPIVFTSSDNTIAEVTGNILQIKKAGTVTITASQAGLYEYRSDSVEQTLKINKKELIIKADNFSMVCGDNPPQYTATYSGFVLGENENNLTTLPTISCSANASSPPGNYAIILSGGSDNNYSYTLVNGTLTITDANTVENIYTQNLKIYPSPVKDELQIESGELTIKKIEIVDLSGKIIYQFYNLRNQINVSALPQGIYFMKLETDKGIVTEKIVKE